MTQRLRWGLLGTGNIVRQFAAGVQSCTRGQLVAVGSRREESAQAFAGARQIPQAYGSYEALLADPDVDAVYVGLPNTLHHEWTIKALRAGKHVLCEKPFAASAAQAAEMFDVAQAAGRVVMEGFMYRSHPLTHAVMEAVHRGEIGQLRLIRTSFCYRTTKVDDNIRFNHSLAGGSLMDVGSYCISYSRLLAGQEPSSVHGTAHLHPSGVDDMAAGTLSFPNGIIASFTCGMSVQADNTAYVCGTEGYIEVPVPWKPAGQNAAYTVAHSTPPRMDFPVGQPVRPPRQTHYVNVAVDLYGLEADDFTAAVMDGVAPRVSRADTLGNMAVLDALRQQVGE